MVKPLVHADSIHQQKFATQQTALSASALAVNKECNTGMDLNLEEFYVVFLSNQTIILIPYNVI